MIGRRRLVDKGVMKTSLQRKTNSKKESSLHLSLESPVHIGSDLFFNELNNLFLVGDA